MGENSLFDSSLSEDNTNSFSMSRAFKSSLY